MARMFMESDDGRTRVEVLWDEDGDGSAYGYCRPCDVALSDRGNFEDTCEAVANHIDNYHQDLED
jgi:hypothetical protein